MNHLFGKINFISYSSPYFLNFFKSTSPRVKNLPFSVLSIPRNMLFNYAYFHRFLYPLKNFNLAVISVQISIQSYATYLSAFASIKTSISGHITPSFLHYFDLSSQKQSYQLLLANILPSFNPLFNQKYELNIAFQHFPFLAK